jgi:hypothetical protein
VTASDERERIALVVHEVRSPTAAPRDDRRSAVKEGRQNEAVEAQGRILEPGVTSVRPLPGGGSGSQSCARSPKPTAEQPLSIRGSGPGATFAISLPVDGPQPAGTTSSS